MCYAWEKILYDRLSISFSIQKNLKKKKKTAYLPPYLAFSDMLSEPHVFLFGLMYLAVGFAIQNFRRGRRGWGESYFSLPSKTQYYPSKTWVFPVKPAGLGNTHKTRVFANLASSTLFRHLLLINHWANQSHITYEASKGYKKKYSPPVLHLLQAQQALALLYAKVAGRNVDLILQMQ